MRSVKAFGKKIPILAILLIVGLCMVPVYGAVVNYLSNTITKPVSVTSPIDLSGDITYTYMPLSWTEMGVGVDAGLATDGEFLYMSFNVEEESETFLCVFMDTKEGGITAEEGGLQAGSDYMITDPACGTAWDFWYLAKFMRMGEAYTWSVPDISYWDYEWGVWNCEVPGFEAEKGRNVGFTHYNFKIPLECIEYDEVYGLKILVATGAVVSDWVTPTISVADVTTEPFGDGTFVAQLYGGSEFFMHFEAENLANREMWINLALVMECPGDWTPDAEEIWEIDPVEEIVGDDVSSDLDYYVVVFDFWDIGPGSVHEKGIRVRLTPIAETGEYTIKAFIVWGDALVGLTNPEIVEYVLGQ